MIWRHALRREFKSIQISRVRTVLSQARNGPDEAQRAAKRACYSALHDALTLLPNGEYFRARLEQALGHTEPPRQALAVLYLNLNDFTPFITSSGHASADQFLKIAPARSLLTTRAE